MLLGVLYFNAAVQTLSIPIYCVRNVPYLVTRHNYFFSPSDLETWLSSQFSGVFSLDLRFTLTRSIKKLTVRSFTLFRGLIVFSFRGIVRL